MAPLDTEQPAAIADARKTPNPGEQLARFARALRPRRLGRILLSPAAQRIHAALEAELAITGKSDALSLMVGSHASGEGRTTVSLILAALSACDPSRRVLLVDADLERAGASASLGLGPDRPGLLDYVAGDTPLAACCATTGLENLQVVGRGRGIVARLPHARLEQLVREAAQLRYDLVLFDTPPVATSRDPLLIARAARQVLLVVRAAGPSSRELLAAIAEFERAGADMLGCVLNRH